MFTNHPRISQFHHYALLVKLCRPNVEPRHLPRQRRQPDDNQDVQFARLGANRTEADYVGGSCACFCSDAAGSRAGMSGMAGIWSLAARIVMLFLTGGGRRASGFDWVWATAGRRSPKRSEVCIWPRIRPCGPMWGITFHVKQHQSERRAMTPQLGRGRGKRDHVRLQEHRVEPLHPPKECRCWAYRCYERHLLQMSAQPYLLLPSPTQ